MEKKFKRLILSYLNDSKYVGNKGLQIYLI